MLFVDEFCGILVYIKFGADVTSQYDVTGAAEFGIPAVGVLFGYGTKAELEEAGAAETAVSVSALRRLLLEQ